MDGAHTGAVLDGRYELRRTLGQGGEGTVYEAVHRFTGQRHAVKVAASPVPKDSDWKRIRLLREARALGQLQHPNIVAITDAGIAEGFPFVAMELLEGRSVEGLLATRGTFTVPDAVGIGLQVCAALIASHAVGVLHRDVKPGNVAIVSDDRLSSGERVKLFDFGTAKSTDPAAEKLTQAGALVGTPSYMAPEQLMAMDVDEGVDIYAVGAMLFECLTGTVPYPGTYPRVLMAACSDEPPPSVRRSRPEIEESLEGVIAKALAKKRTDRFETIEQLAQALRRACPRTDGLTRLLVDAVPASAQARRRYPRAAYRTPVRMMSAHGEVDGRCEDISEAGMLLLTEQACQQGEEVSVRFALPIEGKIAVCKARVQWVRERPDRSRQTRAVGLELMNATVEVRASLGRYVALMTRELQEPIEPVRYTDRAESGQMPAAKTTMADAPQSLRRVAG